MDIWQYFLTLKRTQESAGNVLPEVNGIWGDRLWLLNFTASVVFSVKSSLAEMLNNPVEPNLLGPGVVNSVPIPPVKIEPISPVKTANIEPSPSPPKPDNSFNSSSTGIFTDPVYSARKGNVFRLPCLSVHWGGRWGGGVRVTLSRSCRARGGGEVSDQEPRDATPPLTNVPLVGLSHGGGGGGGSLCPDPVGRGGRGF